MSFTRDGDLKKTLHIGRRKIMFDKVNKAAEEDFRWPNDVIQKYKELENYWPYVLMYGTMEMFKYFVEELKFTEEKADEFFSHCNHFWPYPNTVPEKAERLMYSEEKLKYLIGQGYKPSENRLRRLDRPEFREELEKLGISAPPFDEDFDNECANKEFEEIKKEAQEMLGKLKF